MLYSQLLPMPGHTKEQEKRAVLLLEQVMAGERSTVSAYDHMMLNTCTEIMQKGVQTEFKSHDAYFSSEFVKLLYANLQTIAFFNDTDGIWYLKNPLECSQNDAEMGYYRDEFAVMNLEITVCGLIKLYELKVCEI